MRWGDSGREEGERGRGGENHNKSYFDKKAKSNVFHKCSLSTNPTADLWSRTYVLLICAQ